MWLKDFVQVFNGSKKKQWVSNFLSISIKLSPLSRKVGWSISNSGHKPFLYPWSDNSGWSEVGTKLKLNFPTQRKTLPEACRLSEPLSDVTV